MPTRATVRLCVAAAALAAAGSALIAPATASAASSALEIDYGVTGSTTLSNPNSGATVTFAPTTLRSFVAFQPDNTAKITGFLPLAPVTTSFKAYGFLPARGTVVFTQVGAATGTLGSYDPDSGFPLSVTARYVVSLRNVVIGGAPANVGPNCQSLYPVLVSISAEPGFDLANGTLDGTYNLSSFANCGAAQTIINDTVPGKNNRLTLQISLGGGAAAQKSAADVAQHQGAPAPRR